MGVYGPYNVSLNQVVSISGLNPNAVALFVDNHSSYDVAVAFGDVAPALAPPVGGVVTVSGTPWVAVVAPGGKLVPIPSGSTGGASYNGRVYLLALNTTAGQGSVTGSVSVGTAVYLGALVAGEALPTDYSIPQFINASSQQRVISVPVAWTQFYETLIAPPTYPQNITSAQALTPAQIAAETATIYVPYVSVTPETGTTGAMDIVLNVGFQNVSHVSTGRIPFARGAVSAHATNQTITPFIYAPPSGPIAFWWNGSIPFGSSEMVLSLDNPAGTPLTLNVSAICSLDTHNLNPLGGYGYNVMQPGLLY